MNELMNLEQAAKFLMIGKSTLRRWTKEGRVVAVIINKRGDRRFKQKDLEDFIRSAR